MYSFGIAWARRATAWKGLKSSGNRSWALAAIQEAADIRRELAARWPDVYHHELEQLLQITAWLEHGEDLNDASPREPRQ